MTEIERMTEQLQRTFSGDAWHGPSLRDVLKDITAEKAVTKPIPDGHSIWELTLHIAAWIGAVTKRLQENEYIKVPDEGDWPEVSDTSETAWHNTLDLLNQRQQALLEVVAQLTDDQLEKRLGEQRERETGGGVSVYVLLHGIIHHNLYHAGQIVLLKKM